MRFLEAADVLAAAAELAGGRTDELGEVDLARLEAALLRVRAAGPGDPAEAAALVFAELSRARPFPAANRAVAWLAACQLLSLNGGALPAEASPDLVLLGEVAVGGGVERLTSWIRDRCGPAGRRGEEGRGMFERFSDEAREVVEAAQQEARDLGHDFLGTEHLLLGLLQGRGGVATAALARAGVTTQAVRDGVRSVIGPSSGRAHKSPHFTPRTKKVLELSLREAMRSKSRRIGPEHILLGILREGSGVASKVMEDLGVDAGALRRDLERGGHASDSPVVEPGMQGIDLGTYRQRMLGDLDVLTGRIRELEAECDRLRGILHRHGIEPDGGERSA